MNPSIRSIVTDELDCLCGQTRAKIGPLIARLEAREAEIMRGAQAAGDALSRLLPIDARPNTASDMAAWARSRSVADLYDDGEEAK